MSPVRDHQGIVLTQFNGLWNRGNVDTVPIDHFTDCLNIDFFGSSSFKTRDGIIPLQVGATPLQNVKRIYPYSTQSASTLIILTYDGTTGKIYHMVSPTLIYGPILSIAGMTDFAFVPYAGRGYISPFSNSLPILSPPSTAPSGIAVVGSGLTGAGLYEYGISFKNLAGETTVSPLATVQTFGPLSASAPVITDMGVSEGGNALTVGATYKWLFTLSYSGSGLPESSIGTLSAGFVAPANTHLLRIASTFSIDPTLYINVYRTLANGSTFYLEWSGIATSILTFPIGTENDAFILANGRLAPIVDGGTEKQIISLSNIPTLAYNYAVLSRNIWRTELDGLQLKFLYSIPNDTTTIFTDISPDSLLGINAPTVNTATVGNVLISIGLPGEFVYVYAGDGSNARKAAGAGLSGGMTVVNGTGHTDPGIHIFGFVTQNISGYNSPPAALTEFTTLAADGVSFTGIPISADTTVVKRLLVATAVVNPADYNGNLEGYQFFFVPNAVINDNTSTTLSDISFYDADLLADASALLDNYTSIPAGAVLNIYHNRLVVAATATDISLALVSQIGQPEAISQISGLIVVPLNGDPITNAQEFRDVLYMFKRTRTSAYVDNGQEPSFWSEIVIDKALGTFVHGVAASLDVGGATTDFLIIATFQGISLFNGKYVTPELSWKIAGFWQSLDRTQFSLIQMINESITKKIYCILPNQQVLVGDYYNGLDWKNIRWTLWSFTSPGINCVAINNISNIILGANSGLYTLTPGQTNDQLYTGSVKIPNPYIKSAFIP
jgi:hypothetical protein